MDTATVYIDALITAVSVAILGVVALAVIGRLFEYLWGTAPGVLNAHHRIAAWLDEHAAPEWRIAARLRSVQVSMFWAVVGGLWAALPAFQSYVPPVKFALLCVGFSLAILFARFTGQKGLPDA
jgi:hypothetical protein